MEPDGAVAEAAAGPLGPAPAFCSRTSCENSAGSKPVGTRVVCDGRGHCRDDDDDDDNVFWSLRGCEQVMLKLLIHLV